MTGTLARTEEVPGLLHMPAELVLPYDAPRSLWLVERRKGMGGSDALGSMGLDPWKVPLEIYLDKVGRAPERPQTDRMRWGQIVEASILEWFVERTEIEVTRTGLLRSIPNPWQLASVDGLSSDGGVVEIKNTNHYRREEWEDGQIPDGAEAQSQHYLDVTGRSHAWVVAQIGGDPPVIRRIERDDALIEDMRAMEYELWQLVQALTPPAIGTGRASSRLVNRLFPNGVEGKQFEATPEFMALLAEYGAAHLIEVEAKKRKEDAKTQMTYLMGDATEAVRGAKTVATWDNRSKNKADLAALKERHPEIASQVITTTRYRQFADKSNTKSKSKPAPLPAPQEP